MKAKYLVTYGYYPYDSGETNSLYNCIIELEYNEIEEITIQEKIVKKQTLTFIPVIMGIEKITNQY